jgi:hypothetical protein
MDKMRDALFKQPEPDLFCWRRSRKSNSKTLLPNQRSEEFDEARMIYSVGWEHEKSLLMACKSLEEVDGWEVVDVSIALKSRPGQTHIFSNNRSGHLLMSQS